jgi:SOS response regulatory protein OraA/RecX
MPPLTPEEKKAKRKQIRMQFNRRVLLIRGVPQKTIDELMAMYEESDDVDERIDDLMKRFTEKKKHEHPHAVVRRPRRP